MPATMNISLPDPLKKFVDSRIKRGGYAGASDYVRELIREDQQRLAAEQLRTLIAEGLASGAPAPVDRKYWAAKRKQLRG